MSTAAETEARPRQRWLARAAILLACVSVVTLLGFALDGGLGLLVWAALGLVVLVAATYLFLTHRGLVRWLALGVAVVTPVVWAWLLIQEGLLVPLLVALALLALAGLTGRGALEPGDEQPSMPEHVVPAPKHPFIVMNPRSGGGKVVKFRLKERAEALGAEVALLEGPESIDVAALARDAIGRGADLVGAAGGDGTQALVAGVAAAHDVPFMVVSAGTRNHFALDLGLDREDPSTCLAALTDDAVELHVDLGMVEGRPFVNNASFGAYAAVVQSPAYRDDKARTTLDLLPDLLTGQTGARLTVHANGVTVEGPQAVLVSDNPYGMGDVAGMGRRARLDGGTLGMVAVTVDNVGQAVGLLRHPNDQKQGGGITAMLTPEVVVTADAPEIPVGVDGEAVMIPTPVRCAIHPQALRVRVPRNRPGVPSRAPEWSWDRLRRLASFSKTRAGR